MTDKLDMSLDDLSSKDNQSRKGGRKGNRGRGGGGGSGGAHPLSRDGNDQNGYSGSYRGQRGGQRGGGRQSRRPAPYQRHGGPDSGGKWGHDKYAETSGLTGATTGNDGSETGRLKPEAKIYVSNLDVDMTQGDIEDMFNEQVGEGSVKDVTMHCDYSGRFLGSCVVEFKHVSEAQEAVDELDQAEVDDRPMSLKLLTTLLPKPRRVVKKPRAQEYYDEPMSGRGRGSVGGRSYGGSGGGGVGRNRQGGRGGPGGGRNASRNQRQNNTGSGKKGGAKGGGGKKPQQKTRKPVTQEDLDAEMDGYWADGDSGKGNAEAGGSESGAGAGQPVVSTSDDGQPAAGGDGEGAAAEE